MSHDVGAVAETLIREERLPRVALVGFSMGGNLVLKMLGEWGARAPHTDHGWCRRFARDGSRRVR